MTQPNPSPPRIKYRAMRRPVKKSAKVIAFRTSLGLGPNVGIRLVDLSETGARLSLKEELPVGRELEMNLEGPGSARPVRVYARIVWVRAEEDGSFTAGASFEKSLGWLTLMSLTK